MMNHRQPPSSPPSPPTSPIRPRRPADIRLAGEALPFAIQHEPAGHTDASLAIINKYADKIRANTADPRGYLLQFAAEAFGAFADRLAAGYTAWVSAGVIQCPSCDADMNEEERGGDFVCGECGYRETR